MKLWLIQNPVPAYRILIIWLIAIFFYANGFARQQEFLQVSPAVQLRYDAKPGAVITGAVRIVNKTLERQTYTAHVDLPSGWKQVLRDVPFELQPGDTTIRLVTFSIPVDAPANEYAVRYLVRDQAKFIHEATTTFDVRVARVVLLDLQQYQSPRFAVGGSTFITEFLVTNKGNSTDAVQLNYRSSHAFQVRLDSNIIHLEPKETKLIQLYTVTDGRTEKINHTLELLAKSTLDTNVRVRSSSIVEIIPRATKLEDQYLVYPLAVSLREVGENGKYITQAEISGIGSLNERGSDQLEFLFRAPETQSRSTLGFRDEYRISYRADSMEFLAGDHNYALSPLTEYGRYASGLGANAILGKFSVGAFFNETRWLVPSLKERGGFFNYQIRDNAVVGINVLNKRDQVASNAYTLRGLLKPLPGNTLDLEIGTGERNGQHDNAYTARLEGFRKWISYDVRYIYSGPNFGGYYRDMNYFSASVNAQPVRNLRVQTNIREENRNLGFDTNQVYAPHDSYIQVGAGYSEYISLYYLYTGQEDRFDSVKYRRREDALQVRAGYNFNVASIYANIDVGRRKDLLHIQTLPYNRFSLYTGFRPMAKFTCSTSFEYEVAKDTMIQRNQERLSANVFASIFLWNSTQIQFNLYGSRFLASQIQTYSMFDASIEHVFPFNHKISLRGRLTNFTPSPTSSDFACALEYSMPLGVPLKRISGVGQLRGTLKDEKGRGIANVMVNVGEETALSDRHGSFFFASLKPGTTYITIDKASIGFDRITVQPMPMEVLIRGGEESKISLNVTRSVSIAGTVTLLSTKERNLLDTTTTLTEIGGQSGVFLEITKGTEIHRRVTDNRGRFLFSELRPGVWTLKTSGGDIPAYHNIEPEIMQIELLPGEKKNVHIELRPRKRTIKMLDQGSVIEESTPIKSNKVEQSKPKAQVDTKCPIKFDAKWNGYILQISSWTKLSRARLAASQAEKQSGLKTQIETLTVSSSKKLYRVYLGVFKTENEALDYCHKFNPK